MPGLVIGEVPQATVDAILASIPKARRPKKMSRINVKALLVEYRSVVTEEQERVFLQAKLKSWGCKSSDDIKLVIFDDWSWRYIGVDFLEDLDAILRDKPGYVVKSDGSYEIV